ncbi:MAG: glycerate kinase [Treponema sp.]
MKFLCASDSFKGSISSKRICELFEQAAYGIFPGCEVTGIPIADGGEGTVEAVLQITGGRYETVRVAGPLMEPVDAVYGIFDGNCAIIEMAAASGLPLVPPAQRNPLYTTSYGTGELIRDALEKGCRTLYISLGGSATNDGGMGALRALGVRFLDKTGQPLAGTGSDLIRAAAIDTAALHPAIAECDIRILCDVTNPLTGQNGAVYTFGKQKGATPEILEQLECGMCSYARLLQTAAGINADSIPGAGAAGGLGAALHIFLNAPLQSGIETILDLVQFNRLLDGVDLVVTGEGCADRQSILGKVPSGIGKRCKARNIPAVMITGAIGEGAELLYEYGIESIMPLVASPMDLPEALERAEELYINAATRLLRLIQTGMKIKPAEIPQVEK